MVTEIMVNPAAVADNLGEWFELYNGSDRVLHLNGLVIQSGTGENHQLMADDGFPLAPGDVVVMGLNDNTFVNGGVTLDYVYDRVVLSNEGDELSVWIFDETPSGNVATMLDRVYWSDGDEFPDQAGFSMSLEPLFFDVDDNDDGINWCLSDESWSDGSDAGSPGELNGPCASYDHDGDGQSAADGDCDDTDATIYDGAPEIDAAVDNDCDGDAELGPVASAEEGSASNALECGTITLDGSASYDPSGDTDITFDWSLVSAPTASMMTSTDILDADTDLASFVADEVGTYVFSLTVRDSGGAASVPAEVTVNVGARTSNNAPVADGGDHQTATSTAECKVAGSSYSCPPCDDKEFVLDASASSDADDDGLSYRWNISSGTGRVYDRWAESTKIIVSGLRPSYDTSSSKFVSVTNTVFVDLVVTDCMGATSSVDTVAVAYECNGIAE